MEGKGSPLSSLALLPAAIFTALLWTGCAAPWPAPVEHSLSLAGDNRAELEKVLDHYGEKGDDQALKAAEFLVANMEGHGFALAAFYDKEGKEVPFNALSYKNYGEARAAFDALEKEHGTLDYKCKRFDADLKTITADSLIENIDLALEAWRTKPWAKDISFDVFLESILPYRGSNEPINSFRRVCLDRYADLPAKMKDPRDMKEAGRLIQGDVHRWVRFVSLYYLHPTDQGFDEMRKSGLGRCEDISNMIGYALRAEAVPSACDYTPYWANRDNNHAWEVLLDGEGHGRAGLSNKAAKIYRKTFSIRRDSLGCIKWEKEKVPRWLSGKSYADVTDQYMETADVRISLKEAPPEGARFAYLCVFNGGEWKAIHWSRIGLDRRVIFTRMGRGIAYLPAYYNDGKILPAGPPFILTKEGAVRFLDGGGGAGEAGGAQGAGGSTEKTMTVELAAAAPAVPDADTGTARPVLVVKPGKTYELFAWKEGGWLSLGKKAAGKEPVLFEKVPAGQLYWLVAENSRRLERIFTIEGGRQVWWLAPRRPPLRSGLTARGGAYTR